MHRPDERNAHALRELQTQPIPRLLLRFALPALAGMLAQGLYSVVDRMYIGRLPDASGNALTGLGLTFGYDGGSPVLRDVSFTVEPGTTVALVGRTGSGKSTFLQLLLRLEEPPFGSIRLGGRDLREIPLPLLRRTLVAVPQETFLFSDTLAANVAMGRPGATRAGCGVGSALRRNSRFAAKAAPIRPTMPVTSASGTRWAVAQPRPTPIVVAGTMIARTRRSKAAR